MFSKCAEQSVHANFCHMTRLVVRGYDEAAAAFGYPLDARDSLEYAPYPYTRTMSRLVQSLQPQSATATANNRVVVMRTTPRLLIRQRVLLTD